MVLFFFCFCFPPVEQTSLWCIAVQYLSLITRISKVWVKIKMDILCLTGVLLYSGE